MPEKPIEEWTLADSLGGLETIQKRARRAPQGNIVRSEMTGDDALNIIAKEVVDGLQDGTAEDRFLKYARVWRRGSYGAAEHTAALVEFASAFAGESLNCKRFLRWMIFKGVLGRKYTRTPEEGKT